MKVTPLHRSGTSRPLIWERVDMSKVQIVTAGERESEQIHKGLQAYNRRYFSDAADLSFAAKDEEGRLLGGVEAWRVSDYVMVDVLWVDESQRGTGVGRTLLEQVERTAREHGACRITLNTFRFQAPGFYEKLGYHQFAEIPCADGNLCFFQKEL